MKRKLLLLTLCLLTCVFVCSCGKKDEVQQEQIIGSWELSDAWVTRDDGEVVHFYGDQIAENKLGYNATFSEDGSAAVFLSSSNMEYTGEWKDAVTTDADKNKAYSFISHDGSIASQFFFENDDYSIVYLYIAENVKYGLKKK